jgi:hypothetical protein
MYTPSLGELRWQCQQKNSYAGMFGIFSLTYLLYDAVNVLFFHIPPKRKCRAGLL